MNNQIISESDYFAMQSEIEKLKAENDKQSEQVFKMRNCWNCTCRHGRHKECYPCDDFENWEWEDEKEKMPK